MSSPSLSPDLPPAALSTSAARDLFRAIVRDELAAVAPSAPALLRGLASRIGLGITDHHAGFGAECHPEKGA